MSRFVHVEITADDLDRAKKFYADAFGLTGSDSGVPDMDYWLIASGAPDEQGIGGAIMPRKYQTQPAIPCLSVTDIEASVEKVKAAGGTLSGKINDIPGVGKHAYFTDSENNLMSMLQPSPTMAG